MQRISLSVQLDRTIPIVLDNFLKKDSAEHIRLKLGETLLLIAKRCGEVLPKYGSFH
jgi:hypothetical protein